MSCTFPDPETFVQDCLREFSEELASSSWPPQGDEESRRQAEEEQQRITALFERFQAALAAVEHPHYGTIKPD